VAEVTAGATVAHVNRDLPKARDGRLDEEIR
jgi:hypothetical protein